MALPNAGEVWKASTTSLNLDTDPEDGYYYYVEGIYDRGGTEYARIRQVSPGAGGFYKFVNRAYMDNSANWAIQSAPTP